MKKNNWQRWLLLAVVAVVQLIVIGGYQGSYEEVATKGTLYKLPLQSAFTADTDYIRISVPDWEARWMNANPPERGERVYVSIAPDPEGRLMIKGADLAVPAQGDYIVTQAWNGEKDGVVWLDLPVNRYYVGKQILQQIPLEEYTAEDEVDISDSLTPEEKAMGKPTTKTVPRHELVATVRVLDGDMVITDILVDGRSIAQVYPTGGPSSALVEVAPKEPERKGGI